MFYNEEAFKTAGVDMKQIKTWDELIEAGKKIKRENWQKAIIYEGYWRVRLGQVLNRTARRFII
ncbi:extracellular solute-binding protein [Enterococcus gallinarum]|nr:extracellular solute-binding protein [Enterococcus gallinarum]